MQRIIQTQMLGAVIALLHSRRNYEHESNVGHWRGANYCSRFAR
jgi:hypothetical protein